MGDPLYLGFDLSTQQLKAVAIQSDLKPVSKSIVSFDNDLPRWKTKSGVLSNASRGEIYAPVTMWLEALDLVLDRLKQQGLDFKRIKGVSGAGMQHGTVFWSRHASKLLSNLSASQSLAFQLGEGPDSSDSMAFSNKFSPNWQDASTQVQCEAFDARLGDEKVLADITGSKSHHRFSGPQILKFRQENPEAYDATSRISLVSSFLPSILLGKIAPIDIGDACGMNLWDIRRECWHEDLLALTAGSDSSSAAELKLKLGDVRLDGGGSLGTICKYFQEKYSFSPDCSVCPFTGDNPATILALPLQPSDAIVSLGTSTTFLMSTPHYKPDPAYHFMSHPTTPGLYMFMLCYKNGSLAREQIRDAINLDQDQPKNTNTAENSWDLFNAAATSTPPLSQSLQEPLSNRTSNHANPVSISLFFSLPEIVPQAPAGEWHFRTTPASTTSTPQTVTHITLVPAPPVRQQARAILESQFLSLRLRSQTLVTPQTDAAAGAPLPPQPRRIYLVGGASSNPAIVALAGAVLGGAEGVFALDTGGNACALGAAYKAAWAVERRSGEAFEAFVGARWSEEAFVRKVDRGYRAGVWEAYGEALPAFEAAEEWVVGQS